MPLFAPPDLFAAMALGAHHDPDLPDGAHLRLMPSPALGFPIAPFAIFRIVPLVTEPPVLWRDRENRLIPQPALEAAGGQLVADLMPPPIEEDARDIAVELVTDGSFEGSIALIDRVGNRVFSERSRPPFIVGGPRVERVRIRGRGGVTGLRTWRVDLQRVIELLLGQGPVALLSLPIEGSRPWYANGLGAAASFDHVKRGAARRLQRPDRPDGPLDPLTPADDIARVGVHAPDIGQQCEEMVGDINVFPRAQHRKHQKAATPTSRQHIVDISIADTLLVQAMDPGVGRYLGLVGTLDERTDGSQPLAYIAVGLFVYSAAGTAPDGRRIGVALGSRPDALTRAEAGLIERLRAREVLERLRERHSVTDILFARLAGLEARGLVTVAGVVPPPDPPHLQAPTLGDPQWLPGQGGPSESFRQPFLFPAPPLGALVALGRRENGAWVSRHRFADLPAPANPARRAVAMMLGRTQPTPQVVGFVTVLASYTRRGLLSDAPVPAAAPPATYRVALADLFGRFGPPVEFDVPAPARPRPPVPAPQVRVVLDGPSGIGGPPTSPGHLEISVVVPPVAALAAGSLDIAWLELAFDGVALPPSALAPIPAGSTHTVTKQFTLPALSIAETRRGTLTAAFVDSAGVKSETVSIAVAYADRRRPLVVPTGLGLIWTSRPGPSPDVELKLAWPGSAGTRYRVYVADEKGLGLTGASRAEVAVEGGKRDRAHTLGARNRFRLLTEPPLEAVAGTVTLNERLPRALTTVQFVRVVPLTSQGREAEFDDCGVVPVAVPTDRTPPPPRVRVVVDPDTRVATVTVVAQGLDLVELQASEPGLFTDPPAADAVAPDFRIRRASGAVNDPIYARAIARGPLTITRGGDAVVFTAEIADPVALKPFIRYSYWAEVRMPPERRRARGIVEVPPAGGVGPTNPAQVADMPRPFSAVSAPASALHVPPMPVPMLEDPAASVIVDAGTVRAVLAASSTPSAPSIAIGPYRLRIWEQWGDKAITSAGPDVDLDGSALTWEGTPVPDDADHPRPMTLRFVVIDPVGRESAMSTISAP